MKNRNKLKNIIALLITSLTIIVATFLPEYLLSLKTKNTLNKVTLAPENYYLASETAIARSASSNLSGLEQMKLIYGSWESDMAKCPISDAFLTESEAVFLATKQLDLHYKNGVFPETVSSKFDNWYSWDTTLYKYTDKTFETYTAYLWKIVFTKYDKENEITVYMTEKGVIIAAHINKKASNTKSLAGLYVNYASDLLNAPYAKYSNVVNLMTSKTIAYSSDVDAMKLHIYPFIEDANIRPIFAYSMDLKIPYAEYETYYLYQYESDTDYGFFISPYGITE